MGLPMRSLHEPTVSSQSSFATQNGTTESKSLRELIADKDKLEEELKALGSVLDSVECSSRVIWLLCFIESMLTELAWCKHEHVPHDIRWVPSSGHRRRTKYALSRYLVEELPKELMET